jgi:hypothetical protein
LQDNNIYAFIKSTYNNIDCIQLISLPSFESGEII